MGYEREWGECKCKGEARPEATVLAREDNDSAHHFYGELSVGNVSPFSLRYATTFTKASHQFSLPTLVACLQERRVQWKEGLRPGEPHVDSLREGVEREICTWFRFSVP